MKLHTIALGCQMSAADAEELSRPWLRRGFALTSELGEADAVIVNTCTVRQHAEDRALSLIGRLRSWKEERPGRTLVVAGCAAERIGGWIKRRFPHVDLVVGARSIDRYPALVERLESFGDAPSLKGLGRGPTVPPGSSPCSFVTVMRGCDFSCAYCIVPAVRGREQCRPVEEVLSEVRARVAAGTKEVTLLGQTVNRYRTPTGGDFADLLRAVDAVEGLERIRFTSPHPLLLGDRMGGAMAECPKVAPHLHLPVQSGSDRILRAMRRGHTRSDFLERVRALRRLIPDLALSTDLIVGFPGETEEDFTRTLSLVTEADLCAAYCAKYSPREGTPAADLGDPIPRGAKEDRLRRLLRVMEENMRAHLDRLVGRRVRVLLETPTDGRTQYHYRARLDAPSEPGRIVDAQVTAHTGTALKTSVPGVE